MAHAARFNEHRDDREVCPPAPAALLSPGGQCNVDGAVSMRLCASMSPRMRQMMLARRRARRASLALR